MDSRNYKAPRSNEISNPDRLIILSFARLDRTALGIAVGAVFGLAVFVATVILVLKGGDRVGPNLSLLGQYFIGYKVSWLGSIIGLIYGSILGFILGFLAAFLRNSVLSIYLQIVKLRANMSSAQDLFD